MKIENISISELKPHPRNYRKHPDDQLDHIIWSIKNNGIYRNIIIAKDGTILAGHGVVEALKKMGLDSVPVIRLDIDPDDKQALKILIGDNEISHLGEIDDRALSEILKEIKDVNFDNLSVDFNNLLGTGFDEKMLANLIFVTRPQSEIRDVNEASEWVGMPYFGDSEKPICLIISFRNETDREEFTQKYNLKIIRKRTRVWSTWYPFKESDDAASVRFTD